MELSKSTRNILVNDNLLEELLKLNFSIYLAYKNNKDNNFIIDLDDIYKFVGFTTKGHAKRLLEYIKTIKIY